MQVCVHLYFTTSLVLGLDVRWPFVARDLLSSRVARVPARRTIGRPRSAVTPIGSPGSAVTPIGSPGSSVTPIGSPGSSVTPIGSPVSSVTPLPDGRRLPGAVALRTTLSGAARGATPRRGWGERRGGQRRDERVTVIAVHRRRRDQLRFVVVVQDGETERAQRVAKEEIDVVDRTRGALK